MNLIVLQVRLFYAIAATKIYLMCYFNRSAQGYILSVKQQFALDNKKLQSPMQL